MPAIPRRISSVFFHQGVEFFVKSCYKISVMKEFNQRQQFKKSKKPLRIYPGRSWIGSGDGLKNSMPVYGTGSLKKMCSPANWIASPIKH